jgi:DNA adenine methylase
MAMISSNSANSSPPRRLIRFTPLRYPGGKGKLAAFVKRIIETNGLNDGEYVEPYAGGAAIALELLFHEYVSHIHINDVSRPIYAFWKSVLDHTDHLVQMIHDIPLTVDAWDQQKQILAHQDDYDDLALGFATFFLNRTNRSGILNGGIIGGRSQSGRWKIDARFNVRELSFRIEAIATMRRRISLSGDDAKVFLADGLTRWSHKTLIYLDPPYYVKGKDLYFDYYSHEDHKQIADFVINRIDCQKWIVSYDNVQAIHQMYAGCRHIVYGLGYSAGETREGTEVMFFSGDLIVPDPTGKMRPAAA